MELFNHTITYRAIPEIEVHKIHGSDFCSGLHMAEISRHLILIVDNEPGVLAAMCLLLH